MLVVLAVLDEHRVHEGQAARLAAQRPLADAGEGHRVGVGLWVEAGDDPLPEQRAVVLDEVDDGAAVRFARGEVALVVAADGGRQREQTARVEPLGEVVLRGVVLEGVVGDGGNHLLHLLQVAGAADDGPRGGVLEDEVAEGELPGDVFVQLREQRLGVLGDEAHAQLAGNLLEFGLRRLQQDGHQRVVLADVTAEVDAGVALLALRGVVAVEDEAHVGDDAQQVVAVAVVEVDRLLVGGGQQNLGPRALAQHLLLLVERILQKFGVLQQDELVELGQVGRVEADGVLDQQDGLDTPLEHVLAGVHGILDELDDGDDELRVAVPAEDVVECRAVALLDAAVDIRREGGQQRDGDARVALLDDVGKGEDVGLADVVHRQDEVVGVVLVQQLERLGCRAHAGERGGIREVEFEVLLVNLRLDVAVLLEDVAVVAAADQQNLVNPVFHEAVGLPALGQPLFGGILHGSRFRHCRIYKYKDKGRDIQ